MGRQAILRSGEITEYRVAGRHLSIPFSQDLDQTRNTLGQLALAFAEAFNTQHKAGFDANGDEGEDFLLSVSPRFCKTRKTTVTLRSVPR